MELIILLIAVGLGIHLWIVGIYMLTLLSIGLMIAVIVILITED